jgi:hypothetical protein
MERMSAPPLLQCSKSSYIADNNNKIWKRPGQSRPLKGRSSMAVYTQTVPFAPPARASTEAAPDRASRSFWRRFYEAMVEARQRQAERAIARYVERSGHAFTDSFERSIAQRFL